MKLFIAFLMLFSIAAQAQPIVYERDIYPIMIRNCVSCHNATTPGMNWLDKFEATQARPLIYQRVYLEGDMPLWFRVFGGQDREILRMWVETPEVDYKKGQ